MPKKIEDLNGKIFKVAWELFCNKGYDNVDMKGIAKECNIAVGTLYNYFNNKKDLFVEVLNRSWEETISKINNRVLENNKESLNRDIINILYYDIKNRKGLGMNFLSSSEEIDESVDKVTKEIVNVLKPLFYDTVELPKAEKAISLIICNIAIMVNKYPNEDEQNIEMLNSFIEKRGR